MHIEMSGKDLTRLLCEIAAADDIHRLALAMSADGLSVQVNSGRWTSAMGRVLQADQPADGPAQPTTGQRVFRCTECGREGTSRFRETDTGIRCTAARACYQRKNF